MTEKFDETSTLTTRENQIAEDYAQGESYQQIADRLCLAPSTVRTHLATIYRKLSVSSKLELRDRLTPVATPLSELPIERPTRPERPSIAVLAFENMSGDAEQEYFSDGISDDIITALSRSPWLFVIARNTTFTYKGRSVDVRRIAEELGVRFVLEGSVRRSGDRMRVTAQLIDGTTGGHVWSERYDGQLADVFDLQDEITRNVVASIQTTVHLSTIQEPVERATRPDLTVWELTMRSWHLLYDFAPESYAHAKTLLERALAIDPESAEANMILSLINHHIAIMGFVSDVRPAMETAYALARRATQLDDRNEYAHWALGISCWGLLKYDESLASLERAVALNPNCSLAYGSLGTLLGILGRSDAAIANQEIAIRSNPLDPSIFFRFSGLALAHYMAGRFETAIEWAERAIHRMPRWYFAHFILAASHVAQGHQEDATNTVKSCQNVLPDISVKDLDRVPLKDLNKLNELRTRLFKAGFSG
ncbi:LuxR C-terminal-related transcriptional regulator [uncultured Roseobacter sp.]|uniref:LuxR C-terminal-related transcriptional regulator n=1 Tax=uncultured Roseobacter sp. TaxID=114847 RepID=UPI00261ECBBC|nr:LuxR C-terminal-related transcriptional regulator [uncultured Roseobacter sp.]